MTCRFSVPLCLTLLARLAGGTALLGADAALASEVKEPPPAAERIAAARSEEQAPAADKPALRPTQEPRRVRVVLPSPYRDGRP